VSALLNIIPGVSEEWKQAAASMGNYARTAGNEAAAAARYAEQQIASASANISAMWGKAEMKTLYYRVQYVVDKGDYVGTPPPGGYTTREAATPARPNFNSLFSGSMGSSSGSSGGGGGGGSSRGSSGGGSSSSAKSSIDKAKQQAEEYLRWAKQMSAKLRSAWAGIQKDLRRPFGEMSSIAEAFTSGSIKSVIGAYDSLREDLQGTYQAMIELAGNNKRQIRKLKSELAKEEKFLRKRTAATINLIRANEKLESKRKKALEADEKRMSAKYEALLATQTAAVDKAVKDYEDANDKLADLVDERDDFVQQLRDGARSFVNSLTLAEETVQKYTRLDGAGSFMVTEEKKTKTFRDSMQERLNTLREWWAGITALKGRGLNAKLIQDLVSAGPEASAAAVNELVAAGQDVIEDVNRIQSELATAVDEMGQASADAWFNKGIADQSKIVQGLEAIKDAAEAVFAALELERDAALEKLKEDYENYNDEIGKQITRNQAKIKEYTAQIEARLKGMDKEFKKSGILAIEGLIDGMEDRKVEAKKAAYQIGKAVATAMKKALGIASPSKVGIYVGRMVNAGLAEGLRSSIGDVQSASLGVATAALPVPAGVGGASANTEVRVFIGDTELTDIVRTEIAVADEASLNQVLTGRKY
jgi:hypothetical protein